MLAVLTQMALCNAQMDLKLQLEFDRNRQTPVTKGVSDKTIGVIAQLAYESAVSDMTDELDALGVKVMGDYGSIAYMIVPVRNLDALAKLEGIRFLNSEKKVKLSNDVARNEIQADTVQNATRAHDFGLDSTYDGTGVLMGVIDVGIDFNHAAFRDSLGHTRIRMAQIYDSRQSKTEDWNLIRKTYTTVQEIEELTSDGGPISHGSHTACTAAGSPVEISETYSESLSDITSIQGVASGTELLLSSIYSQYGEVIVPYVYDALDYQMRYADSVGKPIVINLSLGNITEFRDGKNEGIDLFEHLAGPGKIICFSAGNNAFDKGIMEYVPQSDNDTLHTVILKPGNSNHYDQGIMVEIIGEDDTLFDVFVNCSDGSTDYDFHYFKCSDSLEVNIDNYVKIGCYEQHDNRISTYIQLPNGYCGPDSLYYVSLSVVGQAGKTLRLLTNMEFGGNEARYTEGNSINSFSSHCETDSVISVGSYVSRDSIYYNDDSTHLSTNTFRQPSTFSSFGTTIDGKCIPDVLAPGEYLLSAFNAYDPSEIDQETNNYIESNIMAVSNAFNRKSWYGWMRGTSMACPVTSGTIALWLQADPTLSVQQIREIMQQTSLVTPEMENSYPSTVYGAGLLRAANGLEYIENYKRQTSILWQPASEFGRKGMFNLKGQYVTDPSAPGIYIIDGKKVLR